MKGGRPIVQWMGLVLAALVLGVPVPAEANKLILDRAEHHRGAALELWERLVNIDSGTSDEAGLKEVGAIATDELKKLGYEPIDVGPKKLDPADDYPDYARPLAEAVSRRVAQRGVLTCGTGLGMAYVANRYPGVRAAVAWSPEVAELARKHNDANVLVLPARFVSEEEGMEILHRWLDTLFEGGRHARRVAKIDHD